MGCDQRCTVRAIDVRALYQKVGKGHGKKRFHGNTSASYRQGADGPRAGKFFQKRLDAGRESSPTAFHFYRKNLASGCKHKVNFFVSRPPVVQFGVGASRQIQQMRPDPRLHDSSPFIGTVPKVGKGSFLMNIAQGVVEHLKFRA